ncbi:hypothetical protein SAMN06295879_3669 [Agreia bicolorata]|uniref:Uncharacterized protein n=2 Tax=Agreia bicolorata TaxID=110935 RepID=A0A1T4YMU4_9MICO|nr:hypothetical protein SAMN06295879_3669 [Agreia bicolorata]
MNDLGGSTFRGVIATTKPTVLASGERVVFARQALEGMIAQIDAEFIPLNQEHLTLYPPTGRIIGGSLEPTNDGYEALVVEGVALPIRDQSADEDPFALLGEIQEEAPETISVTVQVETRNFELADWKTIAEASPLPVEEVQKWSSLPPIEWLIAIPVTWGAAKFAGSFFERLGGLTAETLTRWIGKASNFAKESHRDRFVTLSFDLPDGRRLMGFVPFSPDTDLVMLGDAVDDAAELAEIAGAWRETTGVDARIIAYLYSAGKWRLAWFVTDSMVFRTPYFIEHLPDPLRFLGE